MPLASFLGASRSYHQCIMLHRRTLKKEADKVFGSRAWPKRAPMCLVWGLDLTHLEVIFTWHLLLLAALCVSQDLGNFQGSNWCKVLDGFVAYMFPKIFRRPLSKHIISFQNGIIMDWWRKYWILMSYHKCSYKVPGILVKTQRYPTPNRTLLAATNLQQPPQVHSVASGVPQRCGSHWVSTRKVDGPIAWSIYLSFGSAS